MLSSWDMAKTNMLCQAVINETKVGICDQDWTKTEIFLPLSWCRDWGWDKSLDCKHGSNESCQIRQRLSRLIGPWLLETFSWFSKPRLFEAIKLCGCTGGFWAWLVFTCDNFDPLLASDQQPFKTSSQHELWSCFSPSIVLYSLPLCVATIVPSSLRALHGTKCTLLTAFFSLSFSLLALRLSQKGVIVGFWILESCLNLRKSEKYCILLSNETQSTDPISDSWNWSERVACAVTELSVHY